jgi:hypothetical protein
MTINPVFTEKNLILCLLFTFLFSLTLRFERFSLKFCVLAELKRKKSDKTPLKINFYREIQGMKISILLP